MKVVIAVSNNVLSELLDLKLTLGRVIDRNKTLAQKEKDEKARTYIMGKVTAYSAVEQSVIRRLLKPKTGMTIYEAAEILNGENGCIRRKCWNERWYLTETYDTRLDCILLVDGNTNTFRPYNLKTVDLLADDWEEY